MCIEISIPCLACLVITHKQFVIVMLLVINVGVVIL